MFFMGGVDREEKGSWMLAVPIGSAPSDMATVGQRSPVPFVKESIALPAAAPAAVLGAVAPDAAITPAPGAPELPAIAASAEPVVAPPVATPPAAIPPAMIPPAMTAPVAPPIATVADPAPVAAPDRMIAAPAPLAAHAPAAARPVVKRKKRVVREPERLVREERFDPDRRTVFAGPYRRHGEPYGSGYGRPPFGFGW
jgi:translation initiation factor IF-2